MHCTHFTDDMPDNSAISWDDVYRFTGNNFIGRKQYQPFINKYVVPAHCLLAISDMMTEYIPANQWAVCTKYNLTIPQFKATVNMIADKLSKDTGYSVDYWVYCLGNCLLLYEEAAKHYGIS